MPRVFHRSDPPAGIGDAVSLADPGSLLEMRDVGLTYPGRPPLRALEGVSLSMRQGQFVSLIGPSGCGKSTLLRITAGILEPTAGEIVVEGASPLEAQRAHRFGFVFQDAVLLPWLSVQENVELLTELVGIAPKERRQRATDLLSLVGLSGCGDFRPDQLSGGMRQRVSIARALALEPAILLMDEPFSAVDEFQRELLNNELLRIWAERQSSVLFVTHHIEEAVFLSDRVMVMSPAPGRFVEQVEVDLPRPRTDDMRVSPEFLSLRRYLREVLIH
ncbi:MAG: ABC transporter ATP-binding protein [Acidimicrobiales bacterium]